MLKSYKDRCRLSSLSPAPSYSKANLGTTRMENLFAGLTMANVVNIPYSVFWILNEHDIHYFKFAAALTTVFTNIANFDFWHSPASVQV